MDDNKFWLGVWAIIATFLAVVLLALMYGSLKESHMVERLVAGGADPISAHCAIRGLSQHNAAICAVKAVQ